MLLGKQLENIMTVKCKDCIKYVNDPITAGSGDQFCKGGMWDREEDDYLYNDDEFKKYIEKDRFCSEFLKCKLD